ncbi:arylesterase [Coralliovum pocilloporae]|uniref:arylesterase n=1 Tax=Coralliovum pocilloporae TaxID=3066369 RepID=UPI003307BB36
MRVFSVFLILFGLMLAPASATIRILAFGDSLSAGYQLAPGQSFPEQLEETLRQKGHDVTVINGGVSGDTASGGLARLDWSLGNGADLVIVELGGNDALRGIAPNATYEALSGIIKKLKKRRIPVLLAGMKAPPNMGAAYTEEFDAIYPRLSEIYAVPLYPFFLEGVAADPGLNLADGIHPNAKGVARIVDGILPQVEEILSTID